MSSSRQISVRDPFELLEPVLSADAMRAADAYTIDELGIPGFTLMETAGRAAVAECFKRFGDLAGKRITIVCGKGNNGGDGLVMARVFASAGARVEVLLLARAGLTPDAERNLRILESLAARRSSSGVRITTYAGELPAGDFYVDALLGTGLKVELREPVRGIVDLLNDRQAPCVAVDVPTGINSDTGQAMGVAVRADLTVTMGALKTGLLLNDGPDHAGDVVVAEIGIPRYALKGRTGDPSCALRTTDEFVHTVLPRRASNAHKYSVGMALVVAGSPGLTGAPIMASTAAARMGAGAVVCATHADVQPILASRFTEVMSLGLQGDGSGGIDAANAMNSLAARLDQASALLVGCGLGRAPGTSTFVRELCTSTDKPLVIDADGLNAFIDHTDLISRHSAGRWVLTPHEGEFRRLAGSVDLSNRVETVRRWAAEWQCILVLKGMPSLIGAPDGRVMVCGTGNPALATAGTGDVLAGLIAGLLAQRVEPLEAAASALHVGGACADAYASSRSARTMQATDLIERIPTVLLQLEKDL